MSLFGKKSGLFEEPAKAPDPVEKQAKVNADNVLLMNTFDAIVALYERLYGSGPDMQSDQWKWFLSKVFDPCMAIALWRDKEDKP